MKLPIPSIRLSLLLTLTTLLVGCPSPGPCDDDRYGCEDHLEDFALDPSCQLDEELDVEVGHGEDAFRPFADGEQPEIHSGFQGGEHVFLGVRVHNPALDRYQLIRVTWELRAPGEAWQCPDRSEGSGTGGGTGTSLDDCTVSFARRQLVLGTAKPLRVVADDDGQMIEEYGFLVPLDDYWPSDRPVTVAAEVEDPCGQAGTAEHVVP